MRGIILILLILSFCSCNRFWNRVIDGEVNRDVYMDDDRKVVVITYVEDSLSKIKVKERRFGK
tara:strand:+ start:268 stop:456 length:189 start_codon:yes stop_codon:yes gene_type:complete